MDFVRFEFLFDFLKHSPSHISGKSRLRELNGVILKVNVQFPKKVPSGIYRVR